MSELLRLQHWFRTQCDGAWEHGGGIKLETLDNPGWLLDVALEGTPLEDAPFAKVWVERSDVNWLHCVVEDRIFRGRGGAGNLAELLRTFLDWAEKEEHRGA
jgi:hypothetical protein